MTSCNSQVNNKMKITQEQVLENIKILRTAGFFENYENIG
jgi:hypothetical protein